MRINDFIWLPDVVDKLRWKHGVAPSEAEPLAPRERRPPKKEQIIPLDAYSVDHLNGY